jgi:hypothetical protein
MFYPLQTEGKVMVLSDFVSIPKIPTSIFQGRQKNRIEIDKKGIGFNMVTVLTFK